MAQVSMTTTVMDTEAKTSCIIVSKIPIILRSLRASVRGMVVMNQTLWVVNPLESCLEVHPVTSPHQPQTLSIQELSDPRDMVRFPPGQSQLVISDCYRNRLLWINVDQRNGEWKVTSERTVKVIYGPQGLSVHDNQLLVCDIDDNMIHVLSTSGEETHKVNMPQGVRPWKAVAQRTSPGFVIQDWTNKQLVVVTEKGEIKHTYQVWNQSGCWGNDIVSHGHSIYVTGNYVYQLSVGEYKGRHLIRRQSGGGGFLA